jgi:hypothetical protein
MMSSSAASAFQDGGAGDIRTDITVTTRTITMAMDTAGTRTILMDTAGTVIMVAAVMDIAMAAERVMDIAMAADQGIPGVCEVGDKAPTRVFEIARLLVRVNRVASIQRVGTQTGQT